MSLPTTVSELLLCQLKGKHSSLHLNFNQHAAYYEDPKEAVEGRTYDGDDWVSDEERELAIANNSIWQLQWYPNTPIGSHTICASSLEAILSWLLENGEKPIP